MEVFACAKTLAARAARMHFSARSLVKCVGYAIVLLGTCCRNNGASSRVRLAAGGASWGILRPHSFALVIMRCQTIEEARIPKNNSKAVWLKAIPTLLKFKAVIGVSCQINELPPLSGSLGEMNSFAFAVEGVVKDRGVVVDGRSHTKSPQDLIQAVFALESGPNSVSQFSPTAFNSILIYQAPFALKYKQSMPPKTYLPSQSTLSTS